MILIAVDAQGCHYKMFSISRSRYDRPLYMEALQNSIQMIFKKLKHHKGKNLITITEIDDENKIREAIEDVLFKRQLRG